MKAFSEPTEEKTLDENSVQEQSETAETEEKAVSDNAENASEQLREPVSFKGFWKDNFSREVIREKWTAYRESFKGDSDDAVKTRKTASLKAMLVSVAMILTVLTALNGEKARLKYVESHYDLLIETAALNEDILEQNEEDTEDESEEDIVEVSDEETEEKFVPLDPNEEYKLTVPFYSQKDYPTGCELVSTSMLLAKYGVKLTAEELVTKGYVKTKKVYLDKREDPYGPDPNMAFIGDPLEDSGYGCYSGTIVKALKKIMPKDKYDIVDLTGESLDSICYNYVDRGIPVLYWGSLRMDQLYYDVVNHWYIEEGERKGEEFRWVSNEHCMVLIGHNKDSYIFNDPSVDKAGAEYIRPIVEKRFEQLGRQAVAIVPKNE